MIGAVNEVMAQCSECFYVETLEVAGSRLVLTRTFKSDRQRIVRHASCGGRARLWTGRSHGVRLRGIAL